MLAGSASGVRRVITERDSRRREVLAARTPLPDEAEGDRRRAAAYADTARIAIEQQLSAAPEDAERRVLLGVALAYRGRKDAAIREAERGAALLPISTEGLIGTYLQHQLARVYILVGEPDKALDRLEPLLRIPYFLSPGWLRIDPTFEPLRQHPRFGRLVEGTPLSS